eukprot:403353936
MQTTNLNQDQTKQNPSEEDNDQTAETLSGQLTQPQLISPFNPVVKTMFINKNQTAFYQNLALKNQAQDEKVDVERAKDQFDDQEELKIQKEIVPPSDLHEETLQDDGAHSQQIKGGDEDITFVQDDGNSPTSLKNIISCQDVKLGKESADVENVSDKDLFDESLEGLPQQPQKGSNDYVEPPKDTLSQIVDQAPQLLKQQLCHLSSHLIQSANQLQLLIVYLKSLEDKEGSVNRSSIHNNNQLSVYIEIMRSKLNLREKGFIDIYQESKDFQEEHEPKNSLKNIGNADLNLEDAPDSNKSQSKNVLNQEEGFNQSHGNSSQFEDFKQQEDAVNQSKQLLEKSDKLHMIQEIPEDDNEMKQMDKPIVFQSKPQSENQQWKLPTQDEIEAAEISANIDNITKIEERLFKLSNNLLTEVVNFLLDFKKYKDPKDKQICQFIKEIQDKNDWFFDVMQSNHDEIVNSLNCQKCFETLHFENLIKENPQISFNVSLINDGLSDEFKQEASRNFNPFQQSQVKSEELSKNDADPQRDGSSSGNEGSDEKPISLLSSEKSYSGNIQNFQQVENYTTSQKFGNTAQKQNQDSHAIQNQSFSNSKEYNDVQDYFEEKLGCAPTNNLPLTSCPLEPIKQRANSLVIVNEILYEIVSSVNFNQKK